MLCNIKSGVPWKITKFKLHIKKSMHTYLKITLFSVKKHFWVSLIGARMCVVCAVSLFSMVNISNGLTLQFVLKRLNNIFLRHNLIDSNVIF